MSLSREGIEGMLCKYEKDYHRGMNIQEMSKLLYDYTSGYPFLVSRLCQFMDEEISVKENGKMKTSAWTKNSFHEAIRMILMEIAVRFLLKKKEESIFYFILDQLLMGQGIITRLHFFDF